jgi:hypothetical protein
MVFLKGIKANMHAYVVMMVPCDEDPPRLDFTKCRYVESFGKALLKRYSKEQFCLLHY